MNIKTILFSLLMLVTLSACQTETPETIPSSVPRLRIRGSLPESDATRGLIEYGSKDKEKELFKWYLGDENKKDADYIYLFNITKFEALHQHYSAPYFEIDKIDGGNAEFEMEENADSRNFIANMKSGDILLATVGISAAAELESVEKALGNVISYHAGSILYDQVLVENPKENILALRHLHMMMHLYDIVKVEEDGKVPDLHFKHLNAIFRITLNNQTGKDLFDKTSDIVFSYPTGEGGPFIYGFSYFSVAGNDENGYYLVENFKKPTSLSPGESTVFTSNSATHKVNGISALKPIVSLKDGETYEFYAVVSPRIGYDLRGEKFTIDIFNGVESDFYVGNEGSEKYTITIDNFNLPIEPGKRYWFNLTATDIVIDEVIVDATNSDGEKKKMPVKKLMLTSEYPGKNQNGESETSSGN